MIKRLNITHRHALSHPHTIPNLRALTVDLLNSYKHSRRNLRDQTQSAIARFEMGGPKPTLQTLENLAAAAGLDLVIAIGPALADNRTI